MHMVAPDADHSTWYITRPREEAFLLERCRDGLIKPCLFKDGSLQDQGLPHVELKLFATSVAAPHLSGLDELNCFRAEPAYVILTENSP